MSSLLLRNSSDATGAISRCVSALSRVTQGESASEASASAFFSLFNPQQKRGIASLSSFGGIGDDDGSSASTGRSASSPSDDFARIAAGAAADVAGVVNQLNSVRVFRFAFFCF